MSARPTWCVRAVSLASLLLAATGCESNDREREPAQVSVPSTAFARAGPPVVAGTTLDAATGKPLAKVTVTLPDGTSAVSDAGGRFELRGMALGLEGELVARHPSGLEGQNRLLPLAGGRLEVVVRLARPRPAR
jgi:hypothetical protein